MVQLQVKIQELAEHVPKGHIPRTMTVHLRGELTRKVDFLYVNFHELLSRRVFYLFIIFLFWKKYSLALQITTRFADSPLNCQHSDPDLPNYQSL